ncbi:uncharacterized protein [Dendropsophus ebraccatus]|uniref:uncharacterized protein isoform X1 n=1 Tax=Dendropsophus ebraccatus TaxID=150705 RepID=UPI003831B960
MKGTADSQVFVNTGMSAPLVGALIPRCDAVQTRENLHAQVPVTQRTPVCAAAMEPWLNLYPNKQEADQLRFGFTFGFFIPFILSRNPLFADNLKSARDHPEVLKEKMRKEVSLGRVEGPFPSPPFTNLRVSPLGVVPKKDPGKFRLIHHLSHPKGVSVNDGISPEDASVSYVSFDRAVALVRDAGRGALMAKSDIESAFRLLPVHPDCYHLLGCHVEGKFYYDTCLPMGCSISCHYFEMFSTFLEWSVRYETGARSIIHYLDDFLFVAPANSGLCRFLLDTFRFMMDRFGVPVSAEKTEGPLTTLSFLGIEIDTMEMVFRLPPDKLSRLADLIEGFCSVHKVTLRQMQSLLGLLVFACRVMPMGRVFSRRLSLATRGVKSPGHRIRLTRQLKLDLEVWKAFLANYNGRTYMRCLECSSDEIELFTDASGSCGFGAVFQKSWCSAPWPVHWSTAGLCKNLTLLELFPIIVAIEIWGSKFSNRHICFWTDNLGVVYCVNNLSSSSPPVLALLRHLVLRCLDLNILFRARHVPGKMNSVADSLSRFRWQEFRSLLPGADDHGHLCPDHIWDIVDSN